MKLFMSTIASTFSRAFNQFACNEEMGMLWNELFRERRKSGCQPSHISPRLSIGVAVEAKREGYWAPSF